MATRLQYGDPPHLGPFTLHARLHANPAGIVYLGRGPGGRQVSVALLTQGAAADPAARDRFCAAIIEADGISDPPEVVAADPNGTAPWVATAYAPDRPGAERFLDPVLIKEPTLSGGDARGPQFQPYWVDASQPAVPAPPPHVRPEAPAQPGATRLLLLALGLLVSLSCVVIAPIALISALVGTDGPSRPSSTPLFPTHRSSPSPTTTWQTLPGLFSFPTPHDWVCRRDSRVTAPRVRYVCGEPGSSEPRVEIENKPCPRPCDRSAQRVLHGRVKVRGKWTTVNPATSVAEWTENSGRRFRLTVSRFWHARGSPDLNAHVVLAARGPTLSKRELTQILIDINANIP